MNSVRQSMDSPHATYVSIGQVVAQGAGLVVEVQVVAAVIIDIGHQEAR